MDVQSAVGRLLGDGMTETQLVGLLEGLAEAIEDGARQWELSLHDLSAYTAFALGGFTGQVIRDAEEHGYERAAKVAQGMRVLLVDADVALSQAAENDEDVAMFHRAWKARLRLVLENGEYPGLTTKLLDASDAAGEQVPGLRYLLFDMERRMWWRPDARGYTSELAEAGRYSQTEAVRWALQGSLGGLDHATVIVADHGSKS